MTRKRKLEPTVEQPVAVEQPQKEQLFNVKLEVLGSEPVTLTGMHRIAIDQLRQWFGGAGHYALEVPIGDNLLVLDRNKVGYIVVGPIQDENNQVENND